MAAKAALLQWYRQDFPVGSGPQGVAFDGANIWVTNKNDDTVTKLRASDGANLGSFPVGDQPIGLAFDRPTSGWRTRPATRSPSCPDDDGRHVWEAWRTQAVTRTKVFW